MNQNIDTRGGAYIGENVNTNGGNFVGRDQIEVNIDKIEAGSQVHIHIPPQSEELPPPAPENLPRVEGFVGRILELNHYCQQLESTNAALITGMPGIGKTWLAAQLAQQISVSEKVFWHHCLPNEGVHAVIWAFAGFLSTQGNSGLWQVLNQSQKNELPPLNVLLSYLFQALAGQNYLICLDDLHHLDIDPSFERLVERMRQAVQNGEIRLIVTAQQAVEFVRHAATQPLAGLTIADTRQLLATQNVVLVEPLLHLLHDRTEGNAQLLALAAQTLQRTSDHTSLIERLLRAREIKNYLLKQVDEGLNDEQRLVMQGVAALLDWPGTADEIEELLDGQNVRRTLTYLSNRYLLEELEGELDTQYDAHAVVKSFYYDLLGRRQRQVLHQRAAIYYARAAPNSLKVALHHLQAEEFEQAALCATQETYRHLWTGRAPLLLTLLTECVKQPLPDELAVRAYLAQGNVYTFFQQLAPAQQAYQDALEILASLPVSSTVQQLTVQTHRELGFLLRSAAPAESLSWLQKGLALVADGDPMQQADLLVQIGDVQLRLGDQAAAQTALTAGLAKLPRTASRVRLLALILLGKYQFYQSDLENCGASWRQALRLAEQLRDPFNLLIITKNLADLEQTTGDWAAAHVHYAQATQLATELGDREEQANIALNHGVLHLHQHNFAPATTFLVAALGQSRQSELHDLAIACLCYLAELQLLQHDLAATQLALAEAADLVTTYEFEYMAPFLYVLQARYFLAQVKLEQASDFAKRAQTSAREQGMAQEEGQAFRVLGETQLVGQQIEAAMDSFQNSLDLVKTIPYEAACTQHAWGRALLAAGVADVTEKLSHAQATFLQLGVECNANVPSTAQQEK